MRPEDESPSAARPPAADRPDETARGPAVTGADTGAVDPDAGAADPWASDAERLPFDDEDPTPAAVIAAAHALPPPPPAPEATGPASPPRLPPAVTVDFPSGAYPTVPSAGGHPSGAYPTVPSAGGYPSGAYPTVTYTGGPAGGFPAGPPAGGHPGSLPPVHWPAPAGPVPRRRRGRLIGLVAVLMVLACLAAGAVAVVAFPWLRDRVAGSGPDGSAPSPRPGAPFEVRQEWVKQRIGAALVEQQLALLAGDETRYLAVVDSAAPQVLDQMRIQFHSLRAMQVAAWTDEPTDPVPAEGGPDWTTELRGTPCFVTPTCAKASARATARWRIRDGRAYLVDWRPGDKQPSPHPWQVDDLVAVSGSRTVVATTPQHAKQLTRLLAEAEKAAKVADRFARDGAVPPRYVVYYAGEREWRSWFTWDPADTVSGVALRVSVDRWELMLYDRNVTPDVLGGVLRHELTHASSLAGPFQDSDTMWWLHEGLAEYAGMDGVRPRDYLRLPAVAELMDGWDGEVENPLPPKGTDGWVVSARYGVSALAVWHLADRFGEEKLVEFFHRVVHDSAPVEAAARDVFGADWAVLERECAEFVRRTARRS